MKRIGNLYDQLISIDNLMEAERKARRGKTSRKGIEWFDRDPDGNIRRLHDILESGEYHTSNYRTFIIHEPKERVISSLPYYPDRIVHHAIINVLGPIWQSIFTADTYSCIPGKGLHLCARNMKMALRNDPEGTKYCLQMDISKFYPSIDHEVLKSIIRRKIKCVRTLSLLDELIDSCQGISIGNYPSPYLSNLLLAYLDHTIKEVYKVKYYYRYADDMCILGHSKEELHRIRFMIDQELQELKLKMKSNWQVYPIDARPIDFVGYVFCHSHTRLRKSIKQRIFRVVSNYTHGKIDKESFEKSMASYYGWMKHCDSRNLSKRINLIIKNYESTVREQTTTC